MEGFWGSFASNESVEKLFYVSAQELKKRPLKAGPNAPISGGPWMGLSVKRRGNTVVHRLQESTDIKWEDLSDLFNDTSKLKSLMFFMTATPTDCAEISFHTWMFLSSVCVCSYTLYIVP